MSKSKSMSMSSGVAVVASSVGGSRSLGEFMAPAVPIEGFGWRSLGLDNNYNNLMAELLFWTFWYRCCRSTPRDATNN